MLYKGMLVRCWSEKASQKGYHEGYGCGYLEYFRNRNSQAKILWSGHVWYIKEQQGGHCGWGRVSEVESNQG